MPKTLPLPSSRTNTIYQKLAQVESFTVPRAHTYALFDRNILKIERGRDKRALTTGEISSLCNQYVVFDVYDFVNGNITYVKKVVSARWIGYNAPFHVSSLRVK